MTTRKEIKRKYNAPVLSPPCKGWRMDLASPGGMVTVPNILGHPRLNMQNHQYLEISRSISSARGWVTVLAVPSIYLALQMIYSMISDWKASDLDFQLSVILLSILMVWTMPFFLRVDLCTPLNEPIRFNRARQKIYAYNFKPRWTAPFSAWPIEIAVYDWSQVRAELWSQGSGGYRKCGTMLSIVKPGTNEVIDRFSLNHDTLSEDPWLYIHTYMEKGPETLPPFDTPRDANELVWYSPFCRWAPKVKWPEDIDRESTTAP